MITIITLLTILQHEKSQYLANPFFLPTRRTLENLKKGDPVGKICDS